MKLRETVLSATTAELDNAPGVFSSAYATACRVGWVSLDRTKLIHVYLALSPKHALERCLSYRLRTTGAWGNAEVQLCGSEEPAGQLDGFADEAETAIVLTHPLDGYFRRRDGCLGSYSVWHDRLSLRRGRAMKARFEVFEQLGLVAPGALPHSVLLQPTTEFIILLPPHRLP